MVNNNYTCILFTFQIGNEFISWFHFIFLLTKRELTMTLIGGEIMRILREFN